MAEDIGPIISVELLREGIDIREWPAARAAAFNSRLAVRYGAIAPVVAELKSTKWKYSVGAVAGIFLCGAVVYALKDKLVDIPDAPDKEPMYVKLGDNETLSNGNILEINPNGTSVLHTVSEDTFLTRAQTLEELAEDEGYDKKIKDHVWENDEGDQIRLTFTPAVSGDAFVYGFTPDMADAVSAQLTGVTVSGEGELVAQYDWGNSTYNYFVRDSNGDHVVTTSDFINAANVVEDGGIGGSYFGEAFVTYMDNIVASDAQEAYALVESQLRTYLNETWSIPNEDLAGHDLDGLVGIMLGEGNATYTAVYGNFLDDLFKVAVDAGLEGNYSDMNSLVDGLIQYGENLTQLRETNATELYNEFSVAFASLSTDGGAALRALNDTIQRFMSLDDVFGAYKFDNSPAGVLAISHLSNNVADKNNTAYEWIKEQYNNQRDVYVFNPNGADAIMVAYDRSSDIPIKMDEPIDEATEYDVIASAMSNYNG